MAALRSMPRWAVCLALLVVAAEASHLDQMLAAHHRVRNVAKGTTKLEGGDACVVGEFPIQFREETDFNINEGFGVFRDEGTNLECHCVEKECQCFGEDEEDCDEYSQLWFFGLAYAHQFGSFFYDLPKYEEQYHLQSMMFWTILGLILFWAGITTVVYMEVKAVTVQRERDERKKLVQARAMERCSALRELEDKEAQIMAPRPYITLSGAIVLFVGLFCQLIPFCHLLRALGFYVEVHGMCILFVLLNSFVLAACLTLLILGLVWSCTRGMAAIVFLTLSLLGDVMIWGGTLSVIIWLAVTGFSLWLYFSYLPAQFEDQKDPDDINNGGYPWWLQDAGDFAIETELSKISEAYQGFSKGVASDVTDNPIGEKVKELGDQVAGNSATV
mmetsp:Transcript_43171/g.101928  ORF Transcript_43171/g.101928 Transcript_43171/m.101928 type:complete len:388 (-) Transcript_43171:109-1272(-)